MLTENTHREILLITLVHPDFLPPVYAIAQVLRDTGYYIHILTFESLVPSESDLGSRIALEPVGRHYDAGLVERIKLRYKFQKRAMQLANDKTAAVISFCPFSFHAGVRIKSRFKIPLIYHALELSDFRFSSFLKSPLSNYRNLWALHSLSNADIIATPSVQRSAWLAGRVHLDKMPLTILNTAYLANQPVAGTYNIFKDIVPADFSDKKIILYTGAVNTDTCILELVWAFDMVSDEKSALVINGVKDDTYAAEIKYTVSGCASKNRILLLPYLTRDKVMALQEHGHIGVSLISPDRYTGGGNVNAKMAAPNKVGEYMANNLLIMGIANDYLRPLEMMGMAVLAVSPDPVDMSEAIKKALALAEDQTYKMRIRKYVEAFFCMNQQLKPVIDYIDQFGE